MGSDEIVTCEEEAALRTILELGATQAFDSSVVARVEARDRLGLPLEMLAANPSVHF